MIDRDGDANAFDIEHQHELAALANQIRDLQVEASVDKRTIDNLQVALQSARQIGAAVGIVMAATRATQEQAFHMLKKASQNTNTKLRDVAEEVLLTGVLLPHGRGREEPDVPAVQSVA